MTDDTPEKPKNGWSPERRARAAERIRENRPWEHSTGPKTKAGKDRAALNAFKLGLYVPLGRDLSPLTKSGPTYED